MNSLVRCIERKLFDLHSCMCRYKYIVGQRSCVQGKELDSCKNECTEVQNPSRRYSWPLITIMRMRALNGQPTYMTERQINATQLAQGRYFSKKKTASGGIRTHFMAFNGRVLDVRNGAVSEKNHEFFDLCCLLST